jgi:CTP:molybdopterin cytidylyltransferase MocA
MSLRADLLQLGSGGGLRALFDANSNLVKRVPVESPFVARDMDTWDDYQALHLDVFGTEPYTDQVKKN